MTKYHVLSLLAAVVYLTCTGFKHYSGAIDSNQNQIISESEEDYFFFHNGVRRSFKPSWNRLYIEFNYNIALKELDKFEKDSISKIYSNQLEELSLQETRFKNVYLLGDTSQRKVIVDKLIGLPEVRKLSAISIASPIASYFTDYVQVSFKENLTEEELKTWVTKFDVKDYSKRILEGRLSVIIRFEKADVLSYNFLIQSERFYQDEMVERVETFDVRPTKAR